MRNDLRFIRSTIVVGLIAAAALIAMPRIARGSAIRVQNARPDATSFGPAAVRLAAPALAVETCSSQKQGLRVDLPIAAAAGLGDVRETATPLVAAARAIHAHTALVSRGYDATAPPPEHHRG